MDLEDLKRKLNEGSNDIIYPKEDYDKRELEALNTKHEESNALLADVISSPNQLEPVLAEINHINELGLSKWYEVVYFDGNWRCYSGSKTFKDGEQVIKWVYCKDCL